MKTQIQSPEQFLNSMPTQLQNLAKLSQMRTNDLLRKDQWEELDAAVLSVYRERLTAADDLRNAGLVRNVGGLGVLYSQYEDLDDMTGAEVSMEGTTKSEEDRHSYTINTVPIPIIHKDFRINKRTLLASQRDPEASLDTTQAETSARLVRDKINDIIFNGANIVVGGNSIEGYTNATNRNQTTLSTNWDDSGADPVGDVENMLRDVYADNAFGPFFLYIPKNWWAVAQQDYSSNKGDRTYIERIQAFEDVEAVRPGDQLADDNAVLVQMTSDVVDLAIAEDVQTIQWMSGDTFTTHFKVMAAMAPRVKDDSTGRSGIAHLS